MEVRFEVIHRNRSLGRVVVGRPGDHNVLNALAAISAGLELNVDMEDIKKGLSDIGGLGRRFQIKGEKKGILVLDDYGHHPTEIMATLKTARECWPERRLIVAFQPHRYSRTRLLYDRFVIGFNHADMLLVTPIYAAGEDPIEGVDATWLYRGIREHGHKDVILCESKEDAVGKLLETAKPGDVVMTLGAGDIYQVGDAFLDRL